MLTQRRWRIFGALAIAASATLAYYGVRVEALRQSALYFALYWLVFLVCFIVAVYCALLDIRYIRLQRALAERKLFLDTVGDESFRKALRAAQEKRQAPPRNN